MASDATIRSQTLNDAGVAISYIPEQVWDVSTVAEKNGQGFIAGGGGKSALFSKPYWQFGITPGDGQRDVPGRDGRPTMV